MNAEGAWRCQARFPTDTAALPSLGPELLCESQRAGKLQEQTARHHPGDSLLPLPRLGTKHTSCRRRRSQAHAHPSGSHVPREDLSLGRRQGSLLPRVSPEQERTQRILITMLRMRGCEDAGFRMVVTRATVSSLLCHDNRISVMNLLSTNCATYSISLKLSESCLDSFPNKEITTTRLLLILEVYGFNTCRVQSTQDFVLHEFVKASPCLRPSSPAVSGDRRHHRPHLTGEVMGKCRPRPNEQK